MSLNAGSIAFFYLPHDENKVQDQIQRVHDVIGKTPPPKPGDEYTVFGALVGVVTGIIVGIYFGMPWVFIVGIIGGGIIGTYIGSLVGNNITKHRT